MPDTSDVTPSPVPVLYIGGMGRGGSTVLSAALGSFPGFFPVGELRGIWHALRTDELCGCGRRFLKCPFWHEVGESAFGGWREIDTGAILEADARYCRHRGILRLNRSARAPRDVRLGYYIASLESVYRAVHHVAGSNVTILDSTKDAPYAYVLTQVRSIDLDVVHLIRDSRAVAFSWRRRVARPEYEHIPGLRGTSMEQMTPFAVGVHWMARNALFEALSATGVRSLRVNYESFVADPATQVAAIAEWCDVPLQSTRLSVLTAREYESAPHHTVGGNRIRFERGRVPIRLDDEWSGVMSPRDRAVVTAVTAPLLLKYGYGPLRKRP